MTKEELEKEAEEKYSKVDREFIDCQDEGEVFNIGYILGAEPREKRIAELEKENAELKEKLEVVIALKDEEMGCIETDFNTFKSKAKELLNEFMRISKASDEDFEHDYSELIGEAEQFLNSEGK